MEFGLLELPGFPSSPLLLTWLSELSLVEFGISKLSIVTWWKFITLFQTFAYVDRYRLRLTRLNLILPCPIALPYKYRVQIMVTVIWHNSGQPGNTNFENCCRKIFLPQLVFVTDTTSQLPALLLKLSSSSDLSSPITVPSLGRWFLIILKT